jgi:hypothetical protein
MPATIYDLPKEVFACDVAPSPSELAEQEDELMLGSITHPNAQTLALNAQKRVRASRTKHLPTRRWVF